MYLFAGVWVVTLRVIMTTLTSFFSTSTFRWITVFLLVLLGTLFSALNVLWISDLDGSYDLSSESYRAVFLDNGQVYFGQITFSDSEHLLLENVFYLQETTGSDQADFSLIKLGGELHGPKDRLHIFLSQVLYLQELRSDSQVVERIQEHQRLSL